KQPGCQAQHQGRHSQQGQQAGDNLRPAGALHHDRPGGVDDVGQRQQLGQLPDPGRRRVQAEPDLGEQQHGPGGHVEQATGQLLAGHPAGDQQTQGNHGHGTGQGNPQQQPAAAQHQDVQQPFAADEDDHGDRQDDEQAGG